MVVAALLLTTAACSPSDDGSPISPSDTEVVTADSEPDFAPTPGGASDAGPTTTEFDLAAQPSTPIIEPIPETGVPGIDSADVFCRSWSEFAGSFQAVGLVSAIGDAESAYRLEVISASTITAAVASLEASLPSELDSERGAFLDGVAGPYLARAQRAEADLGAAGVDPASLRNIWIDALSAAGVADPELRVEVPAAIDGGALDAAVAAFSDVSPPIVEDPALITAAAIPLTEAYLAEQCPDGGILSGNDVIND